MGKITNGIIYRREYVQKMHLSHCGA